MSTKRVMDVSGTTVLITASAKDLIQVKSYSISSSTGGHAEATLYFDDGTTATKEIDKVSTVSTHSAYNRNIFADARNRRLVVAKTAGANIDIVVEYEVFNTSGKDYNETLNNSGPLNRILR